MSELEVTPDGWLVPSAHWNYFRFMTSHEPPRPGAVCFQLKVDAVHWKPIVLCVIGVGLVAVGVATRISPVVFAGTTTLSAYLVMLWVTAATLRNGPVGVAVAGPIPPHLPASRGLRGKAVMAGGRVVPIGLPPPIAQAVITSGTKSEVLFLDLPQSAFCLVVAVRPSTNRATPPLTHLPAAPALFADAPGVLWDAAARQVVAAIGAEAGAADYLGTCHLLLALVRHCPKLIGVDYVEARAAVGEPEAPVAVAAAGERWPTRRLRQTVARAAASAQAEGRSVSPLDLWHALLADPDAECRAVLDVLGVTNAGRKE